MKINKALLTLGITGLLSGCAHLHEVEDVSWCNPEPVTEKVNLAADALFKFDKYAQKDLLVKGRKTLDELSEKLTNGYAQVDKIDLVGHTDRLGSEQYNYTLGLNRAKTIKTYLANRGVNAPISVASAGESQPVTNGCHGVSPKKALTDCLQPDRRVVVNITGVRKAN